MEKPWLADIRERGLRFTGSGCQQTFGSKRSSMQIDDARFAEEMTLQTLKGLYGGSSCREKVN